MQSTATKAAVGVALVALAVVLFIVLSGGDDDGSAETATPTVSTNAGEGPAPAPAPVQTIRVRGGEPVGGVQELRVDSGDRVRFRVSSDIAGEVHVHGYDFEKPIEAGGSVGFDFPAELEGGFEIELHHGGGETQIGELQVQP